MAGPNIGYATLSVIPSMRGAQAAMAGQIAGPASAVGTQAGKQMGGAMSKAAGAALKGAFVGGAIGVGVVTGLAKLGSSFDEAFDTIRVGTGATGEALDGLQDSFKSVFASVPTDMTSAATAIADLNTRLGLTGGNLEATAEQILNLSRITGTDLTQNIESVTRVFGDWGITVDDQGERMDQLFRASQATGISVDVLARQMVQFGAPLRQMGLDFETTAGLLSKFEKEGVNAELVMGSMRIALGKFARDGREPAEALQWVTREIQNAGDAGEANALALEVFGARAGPDMAAAIREGRFDLGELYNTIASGQETINTAAEDTDDWRESWEKLRNQGFVLLEPVATRVFELLGTGMDWLAENAPVFIDWFKADIWPGLSTAKDVLVELVEDGIGALSGWWDDNGETVKGGLKAIGDVIADPLLVKLNELWTVIREDVIPQLDDWADWVKKNDPVLAGLAATVGVVLVGALYSYVAAAVAATVASLGLAAAWVAAAAPFAALAALVGGSIALFVYLWQTFIGFRQAIFVWALGLQFGIDKLTGVIDKLGTLVRWLKRAVTWVNNLVDALTGISPGGGDGLLGAAIGGLKAAGIPIPVFASGGVMPGPLGEHNLAWVAGGETILPTHEQDFSVPGLAANSLDGLVVVLDSGVVAGRIRQVDSYYQRRNNG